MGELFLYHFLIYMDCVVDYYLSKGSNTFFIHTLFFLAVPRKLDASRHNTNRVEDKGVP